MKSTVFRDLFGVGSGAAPHRPTTRLVPQSQMSPDSKEQERGQDFVCSFLQSISRRLPRDKFLGLLVEVGK